MRHGAISELTRDSASWSVNSITMDVTNQRMDVTVVLPPKMLFAHTECGAFRSPSDLYLNSWADIPWFQMDKQVQKHQRRIAKADREIGKSPFIDKYVCL